MKVYIYISIYIWKRELMNRCKPNQKEKEKIDEEALKRKLRKNID